MSLPKGHRIGNYEILGPAGAGGMGEVYRARDSRLDRLVAVKALPAELAGHPERLARFEQEARLLASLNHPNIAGIHGIEDDPDGPGGPYLVLEYVDGPTLAQKLVNGPLGVKETLRLGAQIAAAVEAAHDKGIVHRDLKPGNIMISASNAAKVLDFGLAKGAEEGGNESAADLTASPTVATPVTGEGIVLGTAPYMSPEQARGKPVDRRVDVWAFGCILLECLTGKQAFPGETPSDVIARILEREPDYDLLPPGTPPRLTDIIRRCLTKDVERRPRYIGDLGRELQDLRSDRSGSASASPAVDDVPSVAVLYFKNLANDPDSEYFCTGITEDILTDLSKITGLKVASRNAVSRYQGKDADLHRIATDLGVGTVLEGSVRRAGDRIRITVQLINAADGFQLWGERFDRTLDDVFAVQDEIAGAVVKALRVVMSPSDVAEIQRERPDDARAYDLYLQGRVKYGRYTEEDMSEALDLFGQAIGIDPGYALAWAGKADAYGQRAIRLWGDREENLRLGFEAARKAIELDPKLPDPHKAMSNLHVANDDGVEAIRSCLERAVEIDPRYTPALNNLGVMSVRVADLAGAERYFRGVLAIDPEDRFTEVWLGLLLVWTGRTREALSLLRSIRERTDVPLYVGASYSTEIRCHRMLGDPEAEAACLEAFEADDRADTQDTIGVRAHLLARQERLEEARDRIRELLGGSLSRLDLWVDAVAAALRVGDPELTREVMRWVQKVEMSLSPVFLRMMPDCLPVFDLEEFGPRVMDATLVWPLQAPMIDEARWGAFREVKIASGRP